jgi:hypothetical protein
MDFRQGSRSARGRLVDGCVVTCAQQAPELAVNMKLAAMKIRKLVL